MTREKPDDAAYCQIAGCKRWSRKYSRFICGTHWRRLTKAERRVFGRVRRLCVKLDWQLPPDLKRRLDRIWWALIRRAAL